MRKTLIGQVISDTMSKTRVVKIDTLKEHALYGKRIKRQRKYYVHDEKNESKVGDLVEIVESRPISKSKRWNLVKIVQQSERIDQ